MASELDQPNTPARRPPGSFPKAVRVGVVVELADGSIHVIRCEDAYSIHLLQEDESPEVESFGSPGPIRLFDRFKFTVSWKTSNPWTWERRDG